MDKKELRKRYEELDGMGKALLLEKLAFCKLQTNMILKIISG